MKQLYLILLLCLCGATITEAQQRKGNKRKKGSASYNIKSKQEEKFLQKQWWVGLKAGGNISKANVTKAFSVFAPTNYEEKLGHKKYQSFNKWGTQASVDITFYFRRFALSVQPTFQHSRFVYTNHYLWQDAGVPQSQLDLNYVQEQWVDHAIFPVLARYDITTTKLRPYVQAGVYAAFLVNANKSVSITGTDLASGGMNELATPPIIVGAKSLFAKSYWGLAGGVGANYQQGNIRLSLDVTYQYGMSNIVSAKNRYSNERLAGIGDAMDDMSLDNIVISLGCMFPLRFLQSGFKSIDKK